MNFIKLCDAILMRNRPVYKPAMRLYKDLAFEDIPEVSTPLIKKTLSANGISFEEGHTCFIAKCNLFNNCNTDEKAKIYINKTTGN